MGERELLSVSLSVVVAEGMALADCDRLTVPEKSLDSDSDIEAERAGALCDAEALSDPDRVRSCDADGDSDGDTVREGVTLFEGEPDAEADFSQLSDFDSDGAALLDTDHDLTSVVLSEAVGEPTVLEGLFEAVPPVKVALDDQDQEVDTDSDAVTDALCERGLLSLGVTSGVPESVGDNTETVRECSAVWLSEAVSVCDGVADGSSDSVGVSEPVDERDRCEDRV